MLGAEALHDLVERALHRRQRGEVLDHAVAALDGLAALHRLAVAKDRPRGEIALAVGERLEELRREAMSEIVEHVFARRDVDLDVAPFLGRDLGEPALHQRLAGRDDLHDRRHGRPRDRARSSAISVGVFIAVIRWPKKRCFARFEGRARGGLGLGVERAGLAGDVGGAQRRVEIVVDDLEGAGIGVVDARSARRVSACSTSSYSTPS